MVAGEERRPRTEDEGGVISPWNERGNAESEEGHGLIGREGRRSLSTGRPVRTAGTSGAPGRDDQGRYVAGDPWDRFWDLTEVTPGCWLWLGRTTGDGYPLFDVPGRTVRAHRWAWEQIHGPLPARWTLDHVCHTYDVECPGGDACGHTACVRFTDHLEPLPPGENVRRRHARARALRAMRALEGAENGSGD